ncbi:hypothetical protein GALMADRAFT_93552 [Galerina marginata CBS 339.88]|uniref:Rab-GAP TBC domain-containing protein n=1 Tax=Galerina marginata (strain CBS 339.88) TaxID=685588 RepID=A0A067TIH1_GALM3|nr:hypothetical protein GALMADRAFT_93552 [Galerina marginata CBS 339.88]
MGLEAAELARWTRFAAKGGIGKCTAMCDCVAESPDDLMFLKDDEITVLYQLPDKEGFYLGYCEGVVGKFNGADVHFLSKLKKPVMTKRASVSASTTSGKSPTPSSGIISPVPPAHAPSRRSSSSRKETDPHTQPLERRGSNHGQPRITSPLSNSRIHSSPSDEERFLPPHMSYSSSSTAASDSVVNTPAYNFFPTSITQDTKKAGGSYGIGTPSPRDAEFSSETRSGPSRPGSMPPTRASTPPPPTVSVTQSPSANTSPQSQSSGHRYTAHAPSPLNLLPETNTSPLRIMKRSPTIAPLGSPYNPTNQPSSPPAPSAIPSSNYPDTSYSTFEATKRLSLGSDARVGIGLSLLQDLANGMSDSESDSEDDGEWARARMSRYSTVNSATLKDSKEETDAYAEALRRVGHRVNDSVDESTVEGLGYARSEDDHAPPAPAPFAPAPSAPVPAGPSPASSTSTPHRQPSPYMAPSPSSSQGPPMPDLNDFPQPPTSSTFPTPTFNTLSPATSPTSPSFPPNFEERGRRPSLAPSAASAASGTSTGSWEGASDIYDDYRYSRFSMASKMSGFSLGGAGGGFGGGSGANTPPLPESRPSLDSVVAAGGVLGSRARTDSNRSRYGGEAAVPMPQVKELPVQDPQHLPGPTGLTNAFSKRPSGLGKERTMSVDSDASVYTQNSRLSTLSQDAVALLSQSNSPSNPSSIFNVNVDPNSTSTSHLRPAPLHLAQEPSPLLHTTWGSPTSSTSFPSPKSSAFFRTPVLHSGVVSHPASSVRNSEVSVLDGPEETYKHPFLTSPTFGGFASAMRQRLEEERKSPNPGVDQEKDGRLLDEDHEEEAQRSFDRDRQEDQSRSRSFSTVEGAGLGSRIVVEDEEDLPSRILNDSPSPASSPSPDPAEHLLLGRHLAPLVVANRTPSPSILEGGSDDDRLVGLLADRRARSRTSGTGSRGADEEKDEQGDEGNMSSFGEGLKERTFDDDDDQDVDLPPRIVAHEPPSSPIVPSNPPSTPPPNASSSVLAATSSSPSPSHLRPSLTELREGGSVPVPGTNQRRSLFLPHPNAPKAPVGAAATPGPMYVVAQQPPPRQQLGPPIQAPPQAQDQPPVQQQQPPQFQPQQRSPPPPQTRPSVHGVIRQALTQPPRPQTVPATAPGQRPALQLPPRGPTIYGRTESDLAASIGPVPIIFSVDPPPAPAATAPPPGAANSSQKGGSNQKASAPVSPPRVQMMARSQPPRSMSIGPGAGGGAGGGGGVGAAAAAGGVGAGVGIGSRGSSAPSGQVDKVGVGAAMGGSSVTTAGPNAGSSSGGAAGGDGQGAAKAGSTSEAPSKPAGAVIPRANFFPTAPGLRPRSRSFSGFNSTTPEVPLPVQRSREDSELSARDIKRSLTTSSSSPSLTPNSAANPKSPLGSSPLRPSPLSLSHTSLRPGGSSPVLKSPSSPLAKSFVVAPPPTSPEPPNPPSSGLGSFNPRPTQQLRQASSRSTLNEGPISRPVPVSRTTLPAATTFDPLPTNPSLTAARTASLQVTPQPGASSPPPRDSDAVSVHSVRSQVISPPPNTVTRQNSLRSKLSLPNLRRKQSGKQDEFDAGPHSPLHAHAPDAELLQVKDMEFELVRPNLAHFQGAARPSEDSGVLGRENSLDLRRDTNSYLRPESPAVSISSTGRLSEQPSPTAEAGGWVPQPSASTSAPASRVTTDAESSMDAHRQREQKWMSLMASSPASQARKSKKVKKLVIDGVPSSVRYLVWTYLTDGKGRSVPGVYGQLCGRGKVPSSVEMERDIKVCFQDQPHLQGTQGPVLLLLQAYLNMVPDVQYTMGLTLIVGQLLLLAPEEDAFWIFVSIMDTHIRPYFSSTTTQMEVDAALFSRALESNDAIVARKLLVDMSILPGSMCQPWFSSLFVRTLPPQYLNRVWDLFLFEGVPFLLRVALALITCCRRRLLESTSEESVLQTLLHPPQAWLPSTPDAFLSLVFSVKLKDDDVRKQRVKMEAQVKRQTQVPRAASTSGMISLPRT